MNHLIDNLIELIIVLMSEVKTFDHVYYKTLYLQKEEIISAQNVSLTK